MHRRVLLTTALLAAMVLSARAAPIEVDQVWSRAAMAGRTGVVYLTIIATGATDTLLNVSSPVASAAELHLSYDDNGVMKMRSVASMIIAPGKPVVLRPGGYHIMLVGLVRALNSGDSFPVTLHFAKAGTVTVSASVQKAGANGMSAP